MVTPRPFSVIDRDASQYIRRLINFIGEAEIQKSLKRYEKAYQSSGQILRTFFLPFQHPWWEPLLRYYELERSGRSLWRHMREPEERSMIKDAYEIGVLQANMPDSVKKKFKRDLLDDKNACAYLFEIMIASHYYQQGYDLSWYEDEGSKRPEFKVSAGGFEFDVECKRVSVDASRKIRRYDFYRFAEFLLMEVREKGLYGSIELSIGGKLPPSETSLKKMSNTILGVIPAEGGTFGASLPFGTVTISLIPNSGYQINWDKLYLSMEEKKHPSGHSAALAQGSEKVAVDPIEIYLSTQQKEQILKGIEGKLKQAVSQFDGSRPGIICCFLEGISEMTGLEEDSGLQLMTNHFFGRPNMDHIAGVSYCAEQTFTRRGNVENYSNQGLLFRNPACRFDIPDEVRFLTD